MNEIKVLLAEDELALAHIVRESLEKRNFKVILCPDGETALKKYEKFAPDIIILDIMMPEMDGFTVARKIREKDRKTPIIFLTARSQVKDVIAGFELGANDYLKKPFSVEELIIRIKVQLGQNRVLINEDQTKQETFQLGDFLFDPRKNSLEYGIEIKHLTARESEVLEILCQNHQRVLDRNTILNTLWGSDNFFNNRSLDVFITKLRRHLSKDPSVQIISIRGIGYKLVY